MDVAFADAGRSDADEPALVAQLGQGARAAVAHPRAQAARELIDETGQGAFVRHLAFDAFWDEFVGRINFALEISVFAAALHRAQRPHAAIDLKRAALVDDGLAGAFVRAHKEKADHDRVRACGNGFGDVARLRNAPHRQ